MTSGFSQAYARIVSQETGDSDETESLSSWGDNHPVDDESSVEDPFVPAGLVVEGEVVLPRNLYRNLVWVNWEYKEQEYLYTDKEVEEGLWQLASEEFGGTKANGVFFVKGPRRHTKTREIRGFRCAFYNCCGCKAGFQVVLWKEENRFQIEKCANTPHTHGTSSGGSMKEAIVSCIDSPSKLQKAPKLLIGDATVKMGKKLTQFQQSSLRRRIGRRRIAHATSGLTNGGDGSYYGDVVDSLLNKYKRENIAEFNRDSVYLLGNDVCVDAITNKDGTESVRFYCVLSTENLLLNGPRQMASGQALMLAVDGSYRYVTERDHGLFIVKTINHCQTAKTIAYAICNKEDKQALTWIFGAMKNEIERIVNGLIESNVQFM